VGRNPERNSECYPAQHASRGTARDPAAKDRR
jgi:hypothetical protein